MIVQNNIYVWCWAFDGKHTNKSGAVYNYIYNRCHDAECAKEAKEWCENPQRKTGDKWCKGMFHIEIK